LGKVLEIAPASGSQFALLPPITPSATTPRWCKEDSPGPEQSAAVHGERANEHQGDVLGAADPRAVIKANSHVAFEIANT